MNVVIVGIKTESGCKIEEGEYRIELVAINGALDITAPGGTDDITLIKECIEENIEKMNLPEDGYVDVLLKETGEREDVFWNRYYEVEGVYDRA